MTCPTDHLESRQIVHILDSIWHPTSKLQWGSNIEHSNAEPIQNPNILEIGIGMVWFWNGWDYSYSYLLEPTSQKKNHYISLKDGIQNSPNHLKTKPFTKQQLWTIQNLNMNRICTPTVFRDKLLSDTIRNANYFVNWMEFHLLDTGLVGSNPSTKPKHWISNLKLL